VPDVATGNVATWVQIAIDAAVGLGGAVAGIFAYAWRMQSRQDALNTMFRQELAALELRNERARNEAEQRSERARHEMERRLEEAISKSRHTIGETIQRVCVVPLERTMERTGALEQDMAVVMDRQKRD
jgi:hypothetical protein